MEDRQFKKRNSWSNRENSQNGNRRPQERNERRFNYRAENEEGSRNNFREQNRRPYRRFNENEEFAGGNRRQNQYENGRNNSFRNNGRNESYEQNNRNRRPNNNRDRNEEGEVFVRERNNRNFTPRKRTEDYDPHAKYSKKKQMIYKSLFTDPNEPIRLNKYLANAGICSRRESDEFIMAGVVSVNDQIVTELGAKVKRSDIVKFHDQLVSIENKVYILLNKPKDCVTTTDDPQERKTVLDLVKGACDERIYPVGRLDRNTTGVILLTNDGELAAKLTHPKFLKKKIYFVTLDKNVTKADMDAIASGITLEDGEIHADEISYTSEDDKSQVGIEIHSGKNRIVRRIFESLGYKVKKLDRVFFAGLTKKGLRRGQWRFLTEKEVNMLRMGAFE